MTKPFTLTLFSLLATTTACDLLSNLKSDVKNDVAQQAAVAECEAELAKLQQDVDTCEASAEPDDDTACVAENALLSAQQLECDAVAAGDAPTEPADDAAAGERPSGEPYPGAPPPGTDPMCDTLHDCWAEADAICRTPEADPEKCRSHVDQCKQQEAWCPKPEDGGPCADAKACFDGAIKSCHEGVPECGDEVARCVEAVRECLPPEDVCGQNILGCLDAHDIAATCSSESAEVCKQTFEDCIKPTAECPMDGPDGGHDDPPPPPDDGTDPTKDPNTDDSAGDLPTDEDGA